MAQRPPGGPGGGGGGGGGLEPAEAAALPGLVARAQELRRLWTQAREAHGQDRLAAAHQAAGQALALNPAFAPAAALERELLEGPAYPVQLVVEPTNQCRMACPGCGGRSGKVGYMPVSAFRELVAETGPHLSQMVLHNRGDSLYHPELPAMLAELGRFPAVKVIIHTHGSLPMDIPALVAAGANLELTFSLDGATQESYAQYRRHGDLALALANLRGLVAERARQGTRLPRLVWKFIVMRTNQHEVELARRMARDLGVDRFELAEFAVGWPSVRKQGKRLAAYLDKFVPSDHRHLHNDFAALLAGESRQRERANHQHCYQVNLRRPTIRWDGDVSPCCLCLAPHENRMGNLAAGGFKAVWDRAVYRNWRRQAVLDCRELEPCRWCHMIE